MKRAELEAKLSVIESARRNVEALSRIPNPNDSQMVISALAINIKIMNTVKDLTDVFVDDTHANSEAMQLYEKGVISGKTLVEYLGFEFEDLTHPF